MCYVLYGVLYRVRCSIGYCIGYCASHLRRLWAQEPLANTHPSPPFLTPSPRRADTNRNSDPRLHPHFPSNLHAHFSPYLRPRLHHPHLHKPTPPLRLNHSWSSVLTPHTSTYLHPHTHLHLYVLIYIQPSINTIPRRYQPQLRPPMGERRRVEHQPLQRDLPRGGTGVGIGNPSHPGLRARNGQVRIV